MKARDAAQGKWKAILPMLGVEASVLDGKHHPCPATGQGDDRFRFADRNGSGNFFCSCSEGKSGGMSLLMCCKGIGYAEAAKLVEGVAGSAIGEAPKPKADPRTALNRVRARLRPVGPEVRRYLAGRGLDVPEALREARLTYWERNKEAGVFPCMVARIVGADGKGQSYHLTYLTDGKKAAVSSPRKVMTPVDTITGAAIRLYPPAEVMGVAEGIETAIAARMLFDMPVWSAVTAHGIETFAPPPVCKRLVVYSDNDPSFTGQAAAYALAKRLARCGVECEVRVPEVGDWNDVLTSQRRAA